MERCESCPLKRCTVQVILLVFAHRVLNLHRYSKFDSIAVCWKLVASFQWQSPLSVLLHAADSISDIEHRGSYYDTDEFEVEGVELREQKDEDDAEDRQPPLQRRQRVPGELDPAVRTAARTNN